MWPLLRDSRQKSLKVKLDARELARDLLKWIQPYDAFANWPSKWAIFATTPSNRIEFKTYKKRKIFIIRDYFIHSFIPSFSVLFIYYLSFFAICKTEII